MQEWLCFATPRCAWKTEVFVFCLHLWGAWSPSIVQCHLREPGVTSLQKSVELVPLTLQIKCFTQAVCLVIFSIDVLWQNLYFCRNMLFPMMDITQQFKWLDYIHLFQEKQNKPSPPKKNFKKVCLNALAESWSHCLLSSFCSLFK